MLSRCIPFMLSFKSIPELVKVGNDGIRSLLDVERKERLSVMSPRIKYSFGRSNCLPSKTQLFMESPCSSSVCELLFNTSINSEGIP